SVDLPAPLWPTSPTHSPVWTVKSTPSKARTAPKCFSTPPSSMMLSAPSAMCSVNVGEAKRSSSLHICLDGIQRFLLRVFVARNAALLDVGQLGLEIVLGEGKIGHEQIVRDVLSAIEHLLRHPEGEGRHARGDRSRPGGVAVLGLLLLPPLQLILP